MTNPFHHSLAFILLAGLGLPMQAQPLDAPVELGAYALDRTEVTVGRFRAFAEATNITTSAERDGGGSEFSGGWVRRPGWVWSAPYGEPAADDEPVVHVTQAEAEAFCSAAGGRLPTLAEWRRAAFTEFRHTPPEPFVRGQRYPYPVGETPTGMNVNGNRHQPAGASPPGVNGLYDMGGNAWEWLADRQAGQALTVGGSWWYGPDKTMDGREQWKPTDFAALYIGFRCAYDR